MRSLIEGRYEPDPNSGCWLWTGYIGAGGYGTVSIKSKNVKAHRVAWAERHGYMPPPEMKVCHHCDTPPCVNPAHLFLGTQADNVADMVAKGRNRAPAPRLGSKNPVSVLDEERVWQIRQLLRLGRWSQAEIARSYGVSVMTLSRIANYQTWPHVHQNWPWHPVPIYFKEGIAA